MSVSKSRNVRVTMLGLVAVAGLGCTNSSEQPINPKQDGSVAMGTGGANPTGSGGSTGGGTGGTPSGSGGASVVPVADAGIEVPATMPDASETGDVVASGTRGIQSDPTAEGDGQSEERAPFLAPPETVMRLNGAPTGTVSGLDTPLYYESKTVYPGIKFQYWIYVPAQYQPGKRAAFAVLLDGHHYLSLATSLATFRTPITFDNLIHSGDMPVTITLFINPGTTDGSFTAGTSDTGPRGEQYDRPSDRYSRFLMDEILPDLIFGKYDLVEDPEGWMIGGHSSGGIAAFTVGWHRPDKFRKLLTHNASFINTGGVFPAAVLTEPTVKPLRINLISGEKDLNGINGGWWESNRQAAAAFMTRGYHYRFKITTGSSTGGRLGDHYPPLAAAADYPAALRWMWRGYKLPWYP